jgi:hypothetical protein
MLEVTVTLNGREYTVEELRRAESRRWRSLLEEHVADVVGCVDGEVVTGDDLVQVLSTLSGKVLGSVDIIADLVVSYAPGLADPMENAYDSEVLAAFKDILGLAYPFGISGLMGQLRALVGRGDKAPTTTRS